MWKCANLAWQRMLLAIAVMFGSGVAQAALPHPILFVTQFPISDDFATIGSVFANHQGNIETVGRGGDLWIRYTDGSLRNLTAEAGFGNAGQQGANAIAVRDPAVSWDGSKAVFSMVVGAPAEQYVREPWRWQLYEVSGLGVGQAVSITRVPNQPANFNNVQPTYASNGNLIFVSDRPRDGRLHLYPQHDEYESTATPTGLWQLNPANGELRLMQHSPSGSFDPLVDRYGRVVFTRWDHLQRDQQADDPENHTFDWVSEEATASTAAGSEVFPEPRTNTATTYGLLFNQFFPWQVNQDGSGEETLNHIGRHELATYFNRNFIGDSALIEFIAANSGRLNPNDSEMWLQLSEDPQVPGRYLAINAPEFRTHASGQIVAINAPPTTNASDVSVQFLTPRSTRFYGTTPPAGFSGHYRNPLALSDGQVIAAHTSEYRQAGNDGTRPAPNPRYKFRLQRLAAAAGFYAPVETLTPGAGISKSISYWDPDVLVSYNGPLWELSPVEVRPRTVPPTTAETLDTPEAAAFAAAAVDIGAFRQFLRDNGLAVLVTRNVTSRDAADRQQPFNLRVPGGVQSSVGSGAIYSVDRLQLFQADQVRGIGGTASPDAGRRPLARPLHDPVALLHQPAVAGLPAGAAKIAADGSVAAFVPARRAMTWQLAGNDNAAVVRERYWISAQPGEIRACDGCHGVNRLDQAGRPPSRNTPQALTELLLWWRQRGDGVFRHGFDSTP